MQISSAIEKIEKLITDTRNDSDRFGETLRRERIPHISFSQVTMVEFCPYRYYLQYIRLMDPQPTPDYYKKGKLLHRLLADDYSASEIESYTQSIHVEDVIASQYCGEHYHQLINAYQLHRDNQWKDAQVIGVERAFVMNAADDLPPMVGVIDLILKRDGCYILVDHKTGRNFYPDDELQVAIYARFIQEAYGGTICRLFYDHYRWVNNLNRIRKPAFQRVEVRADPSQWPGYLERVRSAYRTIRDMQNGRAAARSGECFRCPYRNMCD
jgi:CRISPR/Cas system-associated exonuclease Cas4 (RecB family)